PSTLPAALAIDIVTFRPSGSREPWVSEPIIDPVVLEPGEAAVLTTIIADPTATHDVVVAWTVRLPGGDVEGSRTITVPPGSVEAAPPPPVEPRDGLFAPMYAATAALLVIAALVSMAELVDGQADRSGAIETVPTPTTAFPADGVTTTAPSSASPVTSTAPPTTSTTTPVAPPSTATSTPTAVATTGTTSTTRTIPPTTSTSSASTSTSTSSPTTTVSTTTSTSPPTTVSPDGRQVVIRGRVEECSFGSDCLIAGFGLDGDFSLSSEYVCEFEDGSRFVFRYAGGGAEDACAASGENPSITIEVDGVRSPTITREAPNG
ncbi:MAG: hypothetical protein HKN41_00165, partial [Ilumatobacter sp.]|nr:hypothetical protein [Ilumatobacter sp.]